MYGRSRYVKVVNEDGVYYYKSGNQTTLLHVYHAKDETIVPIRINNKANEVA
jgi:hypothetical protein